jgi:hypothetical protein
MQRIMSVVGLVLVLGAGACSDSSGDTAASGPSATAKAAAASPSVTVAGDSKEICAADDSLAGVHSFEDAARVAGPLADAADALQKACA